MKKPKKIKVLIVEHHPVTRAGIRSALAACKQMSVVGETGTGEEAVALARILLPDVMVMDVELPGRDGLDMSELIRYELPEIRIILLAMSEDAGKIERATQSGVCGYVLKNAPLERLVESVLAVGSSEVRWRTGGQGAAATVVGAGQAGTSRLTGLTEREAHILVLIASGKTHREISDQMEIGEKKVEYRLAALKKKLNIRTAAGLTKYAIVHGLVADPRFGAGVV